MLEFYRYILKETTIFKSMAFFTLFTLINLWINLFARNIPMLISTVSYLYGIKIYIDLYYDYKEIWIDKTENPIIIETYRIVDGKETVIKTDKIGKNHPEILRTIFVIFACLMVSFNFYISVFAK